MKLIDTYGRRTKKFPPLIGAKKGINRDNKDFVLIFSENVRVLYNRFLAFSRGPGGFRELREAGRIHFHLSWYLSDYVVTSYAHIEIVVAFLVVNFLGFLVITRNPGDGEVPG